MDCDVAVVSPTNQDNGERSRSTFCNVEPKNKAESLVDSQVNFPQLSLDCREGK